MSGKRVAVAERDGRRTARADNCFLVWRRCVTGRSQRAAAWALVVRGRHRPCFGGRNSDANRSANPGEESEGERCHDVEHEPTLRDPLAADSRRLGGNNNSCTRSIAWEFCGMPAILLIATKRTAPV